MTKPKKTRCKLCSLYNCMHKAAEEYRTKQRLFAIVSNQSSRYLTQTKFFLSHDTARKKLVEMANERKFNLGVHNFKQTEDTFSFTLGWEESLVAFQIVELPLEG